MKNNQGFSLIEVLLATGIGAATLALVLSLLIFSIENFNAATNKAEVRKVGSSITENLIRILSYSSNIITRSGVPITSNIIAGQPGELRLGNWSSIVPGPPGSWVSIANIRRDTGAGAGLAPAARFSSFRQAGVFYILPTPTTSGVLFINLGQTASMSASYGNLFFDRITELVIDDPIYVPTTPYLKNVHIRVTIRNFKSRNPKNWRWCPQTDITNGVAGCATVAIYKDYVTDLNITIPNQIIRLPSPVNNLNTADRVLGPIYFFPLMD